MRNSRPVVAAFLAILIFATLIFATPGFAQSPSNSQTADALTTYNTAVQAKDWVAATAAAQQLVSQAPNSVNLKMLAKAQLNTRSTADALATFERAIAAAKAEQPADAAAMAKWKDGLAEIYLGEGNTLLGLKRTPEAIAAYNNGAQYASKPGLAYFNMCAVSYNIADTQNALVYCRKCLDVDPTKADAWFILGSVLYMDSPMDAKGNVTASAETQQALNKYLELAPDGPHAVDVKAMLGMIAKSPSAVTSAMPSGQPFNSPDGRFSVKFPGTPISSTQNIQIKGGATISQYLWTVETDNKNVTYMLTYFDYPSNYATGTSEDVLIEVRDGEINIPKGTLISDKAITLNGVPGRAFSLTGSNGLLYQTRIFIFNKRQYQLVVASAPSHTTAFADDFMNSFTILR